MLRLLARTLLLLLLLLARGLPVALLSLWWRLWFLLHLREELLYQPRVEEVFLGFPGRVTGAVPLPLDQVLHLALLPSLMNDLLRVVHLAPQMLKQPDRFALRLPTSLLFCEVLNL